MIEEAARMALWDSFVTHRGRPIHKWVNYFPVYEHHLAPYVNRSIVLLEIGVEKGGSLQLWKKHLGAYASIVGIDIEPECADFEEPQISVRIGDQADTDFLGSVIDEFGAPDVIIDDASHVMDDIGTTFDFLFPRLARGGTYIVEDLHTAYWDEYGGGHKRPGSFIERAKDIIDEINARHSRGAVDPTDVGRNTLGIHAYDSMVVLDKGTIPARYSSHVGYGEKPIFDVTGDTE